MRKVIVSLICVLFTACVPHIEKAEGDDLYEIYQTQKRLNYVEGDDHQYIRIVTQVSKNIRKCLCGRPGTLVYSDTVVTHKGRLMFELENAHAKAQTFVDEDIEIDRIIGEYKQTKGIE